jgi:hypothetical protein
MIYYRDFSYEPSDFESEKASNSYVMSLIALMGGMPLPIINLIATLVFYLGNLKSSYYVRWHCTQALLSQLTVLPVNSIGFWWTWSIVFDDASVTNNFIAYIVTLLVLNLTEFGATIYTAIEVRKGQHIEWWLFGDITHLIFDR